VQEEADTFLATFQTYAAGPLITELREKANLLKQSELERLFARMPGLTDEHRDELTAFADRYMNKLLHPQIQGIKDEAARGDTEAIRRIAMALGIDKAVTPNAQEARHPHPDPADRR
jgi:glutamyl-tRNA reductase